MSNAIADRYTELFNNDRQAMLALVACSAALQLDDETACEAVELVAPSPASSRALMQRVKRLGCIWKEWNGLWHVTEDVRHGLFAWLYQEIPTGTIIALRDRLAQRADARAAAIETDDQFASHQKLLARFEAAYQRLLIPKDSERGANELLKLWRESSASSGAALARGVEHLADELRRPLKSLPDAIIFLSGVAARNRGDKDAQKKHFGNLSRRAKKGKHAHIHALSAYWLGELFAELNPATAEKAFRDSLNWMEPGPEKGLVYYSLGSLLAIDTNRLYEADQAYQQALTLIDDDNLIAKVHSALAVLSIKKLARQDPIETTLVQEQDSSKVVSWTNVPDRINNFTLSIQDQMYQFVVDFLRGRKPGATAFNAGLIRKLVVDLDEKFFVQHGTAWPSRAEFVADVAQVMRQVLFNRARTRYATRIDTERHTVWLNSAYEFGTQPEADLLAIDDAIKSLQNIDPNQCRIAELIYYAGLKVEETAELLHQPVDFVKREWRTAKAFIKRELTKGKHVLQVLNVASLMSSSTFSLEFNKSGP